VKCAASALSLAIAAVPPRRTPRWCRRVGDAPRRLVEFAEAQFAVGGDDGGLVGVCATLRSSRSMTAMGALLVSWAAAVQC